MSFNWNKDYLSLSAMIRQGQDPRDKEQPMVDHSEDLLDIMPVECMDTQSITSTMSLESPSQPTETNSFDDCALMANIDALSSLQRVASLLQQVHVSDQMHDQHMAVDHEMHATASFPGASYLPQPVPQFAAPVYAQAQPFYNDPFSRQTTRPDYRDLWRSTLTEQTPDFSVFNPGSKLPEVQASQESVFDPENAVIDDMCCALCKKNGEPRDFYLSHMLKDSRGKVSCPILRKYACPTCGATGDNAHTIRHCPKAANRRSTEDVPNKRQYRF